MKHPDFFQSICVPWGKSSKVFNFNDNSWKLLSELYYESLKNPRQDIFIPKIIHQIWLGGPLPSSEANLSKKLKDLNANWEYKLWDDSNINIIEPELFEKISKIQNFGVKSDVLRYLILFKYGGVYLDCDFIAVNNFDNLIIGKKFIAGVCNPDFENLPLINNAFIASEKNNQLLFLINELIKSNLEEIMNIEKQNDVFSYTGPGLFTREILNFIKAFKQSGYVIYPSTYFYPINCRKNKFINQSLIKRSIFPETYVIHLWNASWFKNPYPFYSWLKLLLPYSLFLTLSGLKKYLNSLKNEN